MKANKLKIEWEKASVKLSELVGWDKNPRYLTDKQANLLGVSLETFGEVKEILVSPTNQVYDGHQRISVLKSLYGDDYIVDVRRCNRELTLAERKALVISIHKATGEWNWDVLSGWNTREMADFGLNQDYVKGLSEEKAFLYRLVERGSKKEVENAGGHVRGFDTQNRPKSIECPYCGADIKLSDKKTG